MSELMTDDAFAKEKESSMFSLLDSILAMILGSLPQSTDTSDEEHFQFVRKKHQAIVEEWKEHFGHLPVSLQCTDDNVSLPAESCNALTDQRLQSDVKELKVPPLDNDATLIQDSPATAAELHYSLGIADNEGHNNWDDMDGWDSLLSPLTEKAIKVPLDSRPGSDGDAPQRTAVRMSPQIILGLRLGGSMSR